MCKWWQDIKNDLNIHVSSRLKLNLELTTSAKKKDETHHRNPPMNSKFQIHNFAICNDSLNYKRFFECTKNKTCVIAKFIYKAKPNIHILEYRMYTRLYTYGRVMVIGTIFISLARQILRIQKKMWKMTWNEYVVKQCVVFRTHVEDLNFEILSIQLQLFYFLLLSMIPRNTDYQSTTPFKT